jgi:hypothetical protein
MGNHLGTNKFINGIGSSWKLVVCARKPALDDLGPLKKTFNGFKSLLLKVP